MMVRWGFLAALAVVSRSATTEALPNGYVWGCLNISSSFPFCDQSLPWEVRTDDLVRRLTLREKVMLLGADTVNTKVGSCDCMDGGVERLGLPRYMNLVRIYWRYDRRIYESHTTERVYR